MTTYRYNVTVDHGIRPTWSRLTPSALRTVMWTCESRGWHYTITAINVDEEGNKVRAAAQGETAQHYDTEDAHGKPGLRLPRYQHREYDGG